VHGTVVYLFVTSIRRSGTLLISVFNETRCPYLRLPLERLLPPELLLLLLEPDELDDELRVGAE
jgi:hypothetical protein